MALPTSGSISSDQILAELRVSNPGRNYPLSLNDADVLALAGKSGSPISYSDLYGKSSFTATGNSASNTSGNSSTGGGTVTAFPSVTVVGGAAPITYSWSFTSNPNSCAISFPTTNSPGVSHTFTKLATGNANATVQCICSDNTGNSRTITANVYLEWNSNQ